MKEKTIEQARRQRKFALVLPLLVVPFCSLFFWALGGGGQAHAQSSTTHGGLNFQVPKAQFKNDSAANKLSFYTQAEKDSLKLKQAIRDDPYYKEADGATAADTANHLNGRISGVGLNMQTTAGGGARSLEANEAAINERLSAIRQQINTTPVISSVQNEGNSSFGAQHKLDMLQSQISRQSEDDPEMKQLSGMLDKVLQLEHPEMVKEQIREKSEKSRGTVFPVGTTEIASDKSYMPASSDVQSYVLSGALSNNGFFEASDTAITAQQNGIAAIVQGEQTLSSGATIKLRLLQDIFINGTLIPKNTFVYGNCSLDGDRLDVDIKTVRLGNSVFSVALKAFDMDGLAGLHVPGAITRDAAKDGADQAIQNMDFYSMSPSIGAQAASAGMQAAKGLFSKKVRLVKVTIKSGYRILLANANQLNQ
ncbi:conjugative transposon protein TraM [Mucilaginibacter boryungensis]|uniref:Conjugative transposon protein TraM n=1 Tax=Mucilaginibacter boryungensis TaxID=768480 RepID=A0ABR9XL84_9SPHI|nr:conjugative transposon protein TraM [Mucilaginibacter boryungensis]MBE9668157.1 conjugative transposon protein TraM [Mucilaginibacter boryungensis]